MTTEKSQLSVGEQLKQARVARGTTCADVAAKLKLDEWIIEALEQDDYSRLPAPIFTRGYLRSYAALMGLDADGLAAAYKGDTGAVTPTSVNTAGTPPKGNTRWVTWLFALLIIAGLGYFLYWYSLDNGGRINTDTGNNTVTEPGGESGTDANGDTDTTALITPDNPTNTESDATEQPSAAGPDVSDEPDTSSAPAASDSASGSAPNSEESAAPDESTPPNVDFPTVGASAAASGSASAPDDASASSGDTPSSASPAASSSAEVNDEPQPVAASDSATGETSSVEAETPTEPESVTEAEDKPTLELAVVVSGRTWVDIRDGNGEKLIFGMRRFGFETVVSGVPPLRVTLGDARAVKLEVNGVSYPHRRFWKSNNFARFLIRKVPE